MIGLLGLARLLQERWSPEVLPLIPLAFVELLLLTGAVILFSAFTTPMLSAIFTLSVFAIGRWKRPWLSVGPRPHPQRNDEQGN